jgi:hypothetical protein
MGSVLSAAMSDLSASVDMDVVDVLLGLDRLPCRLAEDRAQLGRRRFPLTAGQTLGADHELALGRDGDDHLCHVLLRFQNRTRIVTVPSSVAVRCTLAPYRRRACSANWTALARP